MKAKVSKEKEAEATNLLVEIIGGLDTQSESISRLFADAICTWQSSIGAGNILLSSSLSAIGMCKSFPFSVCLILESTIFNFMRVSESSASSIPSWSEIYNKARMANPTFDLHILANNNLLLVLQLFSSIRIRQSIDVNDQLKYIKELQLTVANFKSTEATEAKLALMWGLLITSGGHILKTSNVSRNQLLELARFFQMNCTQAEGWGEGLLGAIGFKKDPQTNKKRILQRCLTLTVFAMFPDGDHNNPKLSKLYDDSMTELKSTLSNKKFSDVRSLGLNAISLIESCNLKMLENLPGTIAQLIRLFYNDSFLISTETFWK